jgi:RHS repeat-associated protein
MLSEVKRPDGKRVKFTYDPLGRRMSKSYNGRITKWVWDGNVILHEWVVHFDDVNDEDEISTASLQAQLEGRPSNGPPDKCVLPLPTTWLFDPDTFAPASKIVGDKHYSIITDHLGTPFSMFDESGVQTWGAELDIFGSVKRLHGDRSDCPFRYPGQYEDGEIGLYYNRFRYYDPEGGEYVSRDPIGLDGGLSLYSYVFDPLGWTDNFGLSSGCGGKARARAEQRAQKLRAQVKNGKIKKLPTATSAVVSKRTGKVYYGLSGQSPNRIHSKLRRQMPKKSLTDWDVANCAEFNGVNNALLHGEKIADLEVYTLRTSTGEAMERCANCKISTAGTKVLSE